jgi:integrase
VPRPRNHVPSYRFHKQSGQAIVTVPLPDGGRRDMLLGRYGSPESKEHYERILAQLRVAEPAASTEHLGRHLVVNEVLLAFLRWAKTHYRTPAGKETTEVKELSHSAQVVRELYGRIPAQEFGPLALAAVRQAMIERGWCRTLINRRIDRVKRVFKWATSQELVPVTVYQALRTLDGLRRGRTNARESKPVKPVDPATVAATLPRLGRHLRAMVELQRLTGMRPGEVCALKLAEIDRTADAWTFRPAQHKTAHHDRERVVMIGPRGQAIIQEFVAGGTVVDPTAPLFSPFRAREERYAAMRAGRKSKVPPSQVSRAKAKPNKFPALAYTTTTYGHAVRIAAMKAGVPHWHPNQLRHLYASEVRKAHGLEAAQVLLGHSRADVTQVYAERNLALASKVAAEIG